MSAPWALPVPGLCGAALLRPHPFAADVDFQVAMLGWRAGSVGYEGVNAAALAAVAEVVDDLPRHRPQGVLLFWVEDIKNDLSHLCDMAGCGFLEVG